MTELKQVWILTIPSSENTADPDRWNIHSCANEVYDEYETYLKRIEGLTAKGVVPFTRCVMVNVRYY